MTCVCSYYWINGSITPWSAICWSCEDFGR